MNENENEKEKEKECRYESGDMSSRIGGVAYP